MFLLGLTGDIACGKSTVAKMLAELGAAVIDSDHLVRELYADAAFAQQVAALFDAPILDENGGVNRATLGPLVFDNPEALTRLEQLVHPAVRALRARKLAALEQMDSSIVVVLEAVKLLESGQGRECHEIWCVVCAPAVQIERLMTFRGLSREAAELRLKSQPSREQKIQLAGEKPLIWIENDTTLEELQLRVTQEWARLRQTSTH